MERFCIRSSLLFAVVSLALGASGCGPGSGKVSGTVLFESAPVADCLITFRPADPKQNAVTARTDAHGRYEVALPAGAVEVVINFERAAVPVERPAGPPPGIPLSAELRKTLSQTSAKADASKSASHAPTTGAAASHPSLPKRYHDASTSGLGFTVEAGSQEHDFRLTK